MRNTTKLNNNSGCWNCFCICIISLTVSIIGGCQLILLFSDTGTSYYPKQNYRIRENIQSCARFLTTTKFAKDVKINPGNASDAIAFKVDPSFILQRTPKDIKTVSERQKYDLVIQPAFRYVDNNIKEFCRKPLEVLYSYEDNNFIYKGTFRYKRVCIVSPLHTFLDLGKDCILVRIANIAFL